MLKQFRSHILTSSLLLSCGGSAVNEQAITPANEICSEMNTRVREYLDDMNVSFGSFHDVSSGISDIETYGFYNKIENKIYIARDLPSDLNAEVCLHESLHAYFHNENIKVINRSNLTNGFINHLKENSHQLWSLGKVYSEIEGHMKTFQLSHVSRLKAHNKSEQIAVLDLIMKSKYLLHLSEDYSQIVKLGPYQSVSRESYAAIKESTDNILRYFDELLTLAAKITDKPSNFISHLEKIKLYASTVIGQYYYNTDFTEVLIKVLVKHKAGAELTLNERKIYESVSLRNKDFQNLFY